MTNNYDGPSFYRHNSDQQPVDHREPAGRSTPRKPFRVTPVPSIRQRRRTPHYDYRPIISALHKQPADYYVVVPASEADETPTQAVKTAQPTSQEGTQTAKPAMSSHALGHSLSDILQSEQQAQRQLKIFDTKKNQQHQQH